MQDTNIHAMNRVVIHVPRDVAYDLKKMTAVTANVLGKIGCGGCHSGRILDFRIIEEFVVNARTLDVAEVAGATHLGA
jgi:mRNA-degrading endonuclease RelE of RelBE toxin-antitoxin system